MRRRFRNPKSFRSGAKKAESKKARPWPMRLGARSLLLDGFGLLQFYGVRLWVCGAHWGHVSTPAAFRNEQTLFFIVVATEMGCRFARRPRLDNRKMPPHTSIQGPTMDFEFKQMTRPRKKDVPPLGEISPGAFYRVTLSPALFGIGWQATRNKIKAKELPTPFGDPQGWTGQMIIDYRARMQALAAEKAAADALRPKQLQPEALVKKVKKTKLKRPSKA